MKRFTFILSISFSLTLQCLGQNATLISRSSELAFVANEGQVKNSEGKVNSDVLFTCNMGALKGAVRQSGITYQLSQKMDDKIDLSPKLQVRPESKIYQHKTVQVNMDFVGSNTPASNGLGLKESYSNFFLDNESNGILGVKEYSGVKLSEVYDGIDVQLKDNGSGFLEYDFIVHPFGNPNDIVLQWSGADSLAINEDGSLSIYTALGELREYLPEVYQIVGGKKTIISSTYILQDSFRVGVFVEKYLPSEDLVIDPFVTYFGGEGTDLAGEITNDLLGNVYVCGHTNSFNVIGSNGHQNVYTSADYSAFLVKFDDEGNRLWSTYYGGEGLTQCMGVKTDGSGNVVLCGFTSSEDGIAYQGFKNIKSINPEPALTDYDGFIAKFRPDGSRIWATYYGGLRSDWVWDIAIDSEMNIIGGGSTLSDDGIVSDNTNVEWTIKGGYIVKLDRDGNRIFGRFFGGSDYEVVSAVACDTKDNIIATGYTLSEDYIAQNAHQSGLGSKEDAYIVKFDKNGDRIWGTYYGGDGSDLGIAVIADLDDNVYMLGRTKSTNNISFLGFEGDLNTLGKSDAFLVKLNSSGVRQWATYLGGSGNEYPLSLAYDPISDRVFLSGDTWSDNFPTSGCTAQQSKDQSVSAFVTQFHSDGSLYCSSYFGSGYEQDNFMSIYGCYIYLSGYASQEMDVTPDAFKTNKEGTEVYLAQLLKSSCGIVETPLEIDTVFINTTCVDACDGGAVVSFTNTNCTQNRYSFLWSNGAIKDLTTDTFDFQESLCSGQHWVVISSDCGGHDTIFFTIDYDILESENEYFSEDIVVCEGDSVLLSVDLTDASFLWNNGSTSAQIIAKEEGFYSVIVSPNSGCSREYSTTLRTRECLEVFQNVPTAITPNEDGLNDVYRPVVLDSAKNYQLLIANRWGEILFKSADHTEGWDAKYKNEYVGAGMYIVYLYYVDEFGKPQSYKGTLQVLR